MKRKIGNRILLFLAGTLLAAWLGTVILTIYLVFCLRCRYVKLYENLCRALVSALVFKSKLGCSFCSAPAS